MGLTGIRAKQVLVTAGASGIGQVIAKKFLEHDAAVHICDIDADAVAHTKRRFPLISTSLTDVADWRDVDQMFETLERENGGIDVLINNAGIGGPTGPIEVLDPEAWCRTLDVNLHGAFHCLRRAVPVMKARGGGSIVNISSTAGFLGYPLRTPYAAAKWAIIGLTKSLAIEVGEAGIRVNAVCPGSVSGPRMDGVIAREAEAKGVTPDEVRDAYLSNVSLRTFVEADDIANMILFACSDQGARISGQVLAVDGHVESLRN